MTGAVLPPGYTERDVLVEHVRAAVARTRATRWMVGALALVIAVLFRAHGARIAIWLAVHVALKVIEHAELRWFTSDAAIAATPERVRLRLIAGSMVHGAAWAALLWAVMPGTPGEYAAVAAVISALVSGNEAHFAPLLRVFAAYLIVVIGVFCAALVVIGGPFGQAMTVLSLIFGLVTWLRAVADHRESRRVTLLQFANMAYARDLAAEVRRSHLLQVAADNANRAKSRFLAAAGHDLRQPVHALGLSLAVMDVAPEQAALRDAARSAQRAAATMLDALLDFSRAEAGVIEPKLHDIALQPLLHDLDSEMAPLAEAAGLVYRTRDCAQRVRADPALVRIILNNFVSNAIRYCRQGGVLVGVRRRGGRAVIEVWDSGIGIAADQHTAIFEEFHQLGNPERDRTKGMGLGLAIARRLAVLIEGEIGLASRPGRGSVFRLALPLADAPPAGEASAPVALPAPRHVMVIDDDPAIRAATASLLASWGHSCDAAADGAAARAALQARIPGLILCDWRLPGGESGPEVIAALRDQAGAAIPAILITGDTVPDRLQEAARLGLPVLHKPVSPETLRAAMAAV